MFTLHSLKLNEENLHCVVSYLNCNRQSIANQAVQVGHRNLTVGYTLVDSYSPLELCGTLFAIDCNILHCDLQSHGRIPMAHLHCVVCDLQ